MLLPSKESLSNNCRIKLHEIKTVMLNQSLWCIEQKRHRKMLCSCYLFRFLYISLKILGLSFTCFRMILLRYFSSELANCKSNDEMNCSAFS